MYVIYAGRVACCPLVSRVEYALRALLRLGKKMEPTDGRTDGRQAVTLRLPLDAANVIMEQKPDGPPVAEAAADRASELRRHRLAVTRAP